MASYNRVIMMGNLTRDPDYKQLTSGQAVCRLSLASNRQFKNKQSGTMIQEVCFIDIDVWGAQADSCNQYLKKGSGILVEGRLKFDTWQDNDGQRKSKHSIVADRVTFLQTSVSAQQDEDLTSGQQDETSTSGGATKTEGDSISTVAQSSATPKTPRKKSEKVGNAEKVAEEAVSTGEVNFQDEKPFADDLPF